DFVKEGFLWKTGPRVSDSYKKRWFVLDDRKLMYLDQPLEAFPKGEIFLGDSDEGFIVKQGVPPGMKELENGYSFTLVTPERTWLFAASSTDERQSWMKALESVINQTSSAPTEAIKETVRNDLRNSYARKSRDSKILNQLKRLKENIVK
ncbi:unnamed protein product, partial [Oppiella nova]